MRFVLIFLKMGFLKVLGFGNRGFSREQHHWTELCVIWGREWKKQNKGRKHRLDMEWRDSRHTAVAGREQPIKMSSFGTNVPKVFYQCSGGPNC